MAGKNNNKPKQDLWSTKEFFVNPYNFVSSDFSKKETISVEEQREKLQNELHTGVLECCLITKTPIAVPDTELMEETEKKGHFKYEFFQYEDGIPVIPGSTLRGAVRSVYETVTESCYATAKTEGIITTRGRLPYKSGILKRDHLSGKWELYEAESYLIRVDDYKKKSPAIKNGYSVTREELEKIGFGTKVYFRYRRMKNRSFVEGLANNQKDSSWKEGYLYLGERMAGKKVHERIFCQKTEVPEDVLDINKAMTGLEETLRVYNDRKVNRNLEVMEPEKHHNGYPGFQEAYKNGIIPIWYHKEQDGRIYLSMACIGRKAYETSMGELLKKKKPCESREKLCKACALFGMASKEKLGSRIRITDAKAVEWKDEYMEKGIVLKELASPKSSYLPFYVKSKNGVVDSYDEGGKIRGRKFYWHSESDYYKEDVEPTKRNATMDLVKPESRFRFHVYYDGITSEQLKELIWTLTLGENQEESRRCYKVGHGKPLGLGSVKILIEQKKERRFTDGYHIDRTVIDEVEDPFKERNNKSYKELLKILDMDAVADQYVSYPKVVPTKERSDELRAKQDTTLKSNEFASHQWFSKNAPMGKENNVKYPLPYILDDKQKLPALEIPIKPKKKKRESNHRG
ncbi:MAG: TIGR03986 family CRISPR-associated RAMP protein [Lachnospiraceae bacterium]